MPDQKYKIFIIDDDSFLLDMYSFKFKGAGHEVEVSSSPEDALAKLRGGLKPDALLCDIVMPGLDGFQLIEAIKKEKLAEGATIIVLSNRGEKADLDRAKELGTDSYIVKARTVPSEVLEQALRVIETHKAKAV